MAQTGVAAINIDGATIHILTYTTINIQSIKSSLRNKLSNLEVMISDEITMVSNDLLFHIHLRLN